MRDEGVAEVGDPARAGGSLDCGADQMHAWFMAEPRVAYKDHVHFTDIGYQHWADALTGALLEGYAQWRQAQQMSPTRMMTPLPPLHTTEAPSPGTVTP